AYNQEWRIEARFRGHGSSQAARDCQQGRQSQPWRWPQGRFKPV
ncbi:MAG: hypothetical protein AVDCRST_MAG44-1012, partial [uncultured Sphingomonas sp.]